MNCPKGKKVYMQKLCCSKSGPNRSPTTFILFFYYFRFCRLVKDTSQWNNAAEGLTSEKANLEQIAANLEELDEATLARQVQEATAKRDAASAELEK